MTRIAVIKQFGRADAGTVIVTLPNAESFGSWLAASKTAVFTAHLGGGPEGGGVPEGGPDGVPEGDAEGGGELGAGPPMGDGDG